MGGSLLEGGAPSLVPQHTVPVLLEDSQVPHRLGRPMDPEDVLTGQGQHLRLRPLKGVVGDVTRPEEAPEQGNKKVERGCRGRSQSV